MRNRKRNHKENKDAVEFRTCWPTDFALGLQMEKKIYVCKNCSKTYLYASSLRRHEKFECGREAQLQCPHCPHRTIYKSSLIKHIVSQHTPLNQPILGQEM